MLVDGLLVIPTLAVTFGFTVNVITFELAGLPTTHVALLVRTQLNKVPFVNEPAVKVVVFPPIFDPFLFHWNIGLLPPYVGCAVKVTTVPEQTVLDGLIVTFILAVSSGLTAIVIVLDTAGFPTVQFAFPVTSHRTKSPSASELLV